MDSKSLLNADYLDIVFDNRNKSYGGYQLRKNYGQRVGKAVAILYSAIAVIVMVVVFQKQDALASTEHSYNPTILTGVVPPPPPVPPVVPPPALPPAEAPQPKTIKVTPPVITNDPVLDGDQMPEASAMATAMPGTTNNGEGETPNIIEPAARPGNNNVIPVITEPNVPVHIVEQMPEFNGDLMKYLATHVNYPEQARNAGVAGRVVIEFVVNEDGNVTDARVVRGIGGGCDEEALRVVKGMPAWKAGKQNGRKVKVFYMLPIVFALQ